MSESDTSNSTAEPMADGSRPVPAIVYLSGERRGTTLRLSGDRLEIGTATSADIRIPVGDAEVAEFHAHLKRRGASYEVGGHQEGRGLAVGRGRGVERTNPNVRIDPERWKKVSSLLDALLSVAPKDRAAWIAREISDPDLRSEVAELVASAERSTEVLDGPAGAYLDTLMGEEGLAEEPAEEAAGKRIGPYRIASRLNSSLKPRLVLTICELLPAHSLG